MKVEEETGVGAPVAGKAGAEEDAMMEGGEKAHAEGGGDGGGGGGEEGGGVEGVNRVPPSKDHRFAILFGYVGAAYQGLQKNPGAHSIESELEKALRAGGLIHPQHDFNEVGWNRAARTDKGVHAAHQVVSLRMPVESFGGEEAVVALINTHLPGDIRAFGVLRVTRQFNSKNFCSGRRYGYLLPSWVLSARGQTRPVAKLASVPEAMKKDYLACRFLGPKGSGGDPTCGGLSSEAIAADPFCNGGSAARAAAEKIGRAHV